MAINHNGNPRNEEESAIRVPLNGVVHSPIGCTKKKLLDEYLVNGCWPTYRFTKIDQNCKDAGDAVAGREIAELEDHTKNRLDTQSPARPKLLSVP